MNTQEVTATGLILFSHIVRSGSLSAAAEQLGIGRAAVSKQLTLLEQRIDVRLLNRSTRSLSLTEVGEKVYLEALKIETAVESVNAIADDSRNTLNGHLNVSCTHALGRSHLVPLLPLFFQKYPDIHVNLQLEDRFVDLVGEKVDISIRVGHLEDSSLIARRLGVTRWQLCASPAYLAKNGNPKSPQDLLNHDCLCYRNAKVTMKNWGFAGPNGDELVKVSGVLEINDANTLVDSAREGLGILMIDRSLIQSDIDNGSLIPLLLDYVPMEGLPIYALYPAKEHLPGKISVFIDFLRNHMSPNLS